MNISDKTAVEVFMRTLLCGQTDTEKKVTKTFKTFIVEGSTHFKDMANAIRPVIKTGNWNLYRASLVAKMDRIITEWAKHHTDKHAYALKQFEDCLRNASGARADMIRACIAKTTANKAHLETLVQSRLA
jgi:hypothetical protein